eukprot:1144940-Pelagomonas_calceolata.AAC.3
MEPPARSRCLTITSQRVGQCFRYLRPVWERIRKAASLFPLAELKDRAGSCGFGGSRTRLKPINTRTSRIYAYLEGHFWGGRVSGGREPLGGTQPPPSNPLFHPKAIPIMPA